MEWSTLKAGGDVLCYCRKYMWNINTCDDVCKCPECGSVYNVGYDGRYLRWYPNWVSPEAREINGKIHLLRIDIRKCIDPTILRELFVNENWEELYELYDLAYEELFGGLSETL